MTATAVERLHTWTVGSCGWGIISVSAKEFVSYGQAVAGRNFTLPPGVCRLRPSRGSLQSLVALFNATMRLTEARPSRPIETEGAARGLEQQAIGMLVDCLSMGTVQAPVEAYRHSAIMACLDRVSKPMPTKFPVYQTSAPHLASRRRLSGHAVSSMSASVPAAIFTCVRCDGPTMR